MEKETLKFNLEVGRLSIGYVTNILNDYCFQHDYDITIKKGSGLLSIPMYVKITVPKEDFEFVKEDFQEMF